MPYTPPSQRSPAGSASSSPNLSRRSSHNSTSILGALPSASSRPELPRSTSYLTRHRRTQSVKTTSFASTTEEASPPRTADADKDESKGLHVGGSLRQSPPPITDETRMPSGAVLSPPESTQNSSDDEDAEKIRGRQLSNLAELQAAIRVIEQHRSSSPARKAAEVAKAAAALKLIMPMHEQDLKPTIVHAERGLSQEQRKISHSRSNTDSSVFIDLRQEAETPNTTSEEEDSDDDSDNARRKPQMLRKKSGELVRPALRPSSSRRRPSSMPGTPTFSKAVHFDSHLEHVRHFLQVDRPLAVSAGSSPTEAYDSDNEYPFDDESMHGRSPPFDWEIIVSNFPAETPARVGLPVRVERVFLSADNKNLIGSVAVANLAFNKTVVARFTLDYWKTTSEVLAEFNNDVRRKQHADGFDRFHFNIKLADLANLEAKTMFFCVKYCVNGREYWDNNNNTNFQIDFRKKAKPQNGKMGTQGAASRPANGLPRSNKKSPSAHSLRPRVIPTAFDDFAHGFDAKYNFTNFKQQPVNEFLGDTPNPTLRLKGVKSAIHLPSDSLTRKSPNPNGQGLSNRYDFGASLNAAIQAANSALGDKSGLQMKRPRKQTAAAVPAVVPVKDAPMPASAGVVASSASGSDSPRPVGTEKPVLASHSYNELLDKYCFFGSTKSSPQLKDGTLSSRLGQYDGTDEDSPFGSRTPSPKDVGSPVQTQVQRPSPTRMDSGVTQPRSTSPAPMTGFVTGTSPFYPHSVHGAFPFTEAYSATAIRG